MDVLLADLDVATSVVYGVFSIVFRSWSNPADTASTAASCMLPATRCTWYNATTLCESFSVRVQVSVSVSVRVRVALGTTRPHCADSVL